MSELHRLWHLFAPYRGWALGGFAVALVALIANVTLLATAGWFIAAMALAGAAGASMNYYTPSALIRACAIARTGGRYLERLIAHDATLRQLAGLRVWFYRQLEPLAPARLQAFHSGDLLSRIRADIDALDHFYLRVLVPSLVALISSLCFFLFAALYDLELALVLLAALFVAGVALPVFAQRASTTAGQEAVALEAELRQAAIDGIQGLPELLVCGAATAQAERLDGLSMALLARQDQLNRWSALSQVGTTLSAQLALWGILGLGTVLVQDGHLAPPALALLALLALASFEAVAPLPYAWQHIPVTLAAARRLFALADTPPAVREPSVPAPPPAGHDLVLRGVCFRYPGAAEPALVDFDLELPAGKRIALVGPTGAGKSTVFNLLLRFWEPERGELRLGGVPLAALGGERVRERIALVAQHTHLFGGTIRENLLLAAPDADQSRLERACRVAQIHDFIASLPEGYDTWVGETGVRLSGGEARRIAIARALLRDAPILLLDEPTEGLDTATERALMEALRELMRGRSTLLITHRPVALAEMDEILVLDRGQVRERGTHRELLTQTLYPRLLGLEEA